VASLGFQEETVERRKHVRILVRVLVDFESPDTYLYDYSSNLSEGGIFVETDTPHPIGTTLTLRFTLPGVDRVFEAKGEVKWQNNLGEKGNLPVPDLGRGMGIQFADMEDSDREILQKYVRETLK
jgi:type IV pilus assembly protein PilZ